MDRYVLGFASVGKVLPVLVSEADNSGWGFVRARLRHLFYEINEFLVSKETVVLRRWERSKQKFGFIKRVDKG